MMSNPDTEAAEDQAIDTEEATDAEDIRAGLPDDIRGLLTKKAFSPGALRKLLRDTYFMGPIRIGTGGWRGMYGGQPGTGLRRPDGALYNFPRSWRYSALERGLKAGVITHVGGRTFAATERGVAVLRQIDVCPDCGERRRPYIRSSHYVRNPNAKGGREESHSLVTACPECGANGYGGGGSNVTVSYKEFQRSEDALDYAERAIADIPHARTFGGGRDVRDAAAEEVPDVDADAITELLDEVVENQAPPSPRDLFEATDEGVYGRPVIPIPSQGEFYRFRGTPESIAVSRTDAEGDIHVTLEADTLACSTEGCNFRMGSDGGADGMDCPKCHDGDLSLGAHPTKPRLKVGMDYHTAVEMNGKDALHGKADGAEWTGDYWTMDADALGHVVSRATVAYSEDERRGWAWTPHSDHELPEGVTWFTVTVTQDAMDAVDAPMVGVEADGSLIGTED